jgi:hypothetical protein
MQVRIRSDLSLGRPSPTAHAKQEMEATGNDACIGIPEDAQTLMIKFRNAEMAGLSLL